MLSACSVEFSCNMYLTAAIAAIAMCWLLPVSVDAIGLSIDPREAGAENNVKLECEDTVMATFYRMDSEGSAEQPVSSATVTNYNREINFVTFVLNGTTEGLYFCRSSGGVSPKMKLVGNYI